MEPQEQPQFESNSDFWISEIRGNIARLNDAAAVVETDIVLPSARNNRLEKAEKIRKIRDFQLEFRRLYKNAGQVLPNDQKRKIKIWLDTSATAEDITNIALLKKGIELADDLQDAFYEMGIKDIDISGPVFFPFEHYYKMIEGTNGTAERAK